jgi:hypothetical protein
MYLQGQMFKFLKKDMATINLAMVSNFYNVMGYAASHYANGNLVNAAIANIDPNLLKNVDGPINYEIRNGDKIYLTKKHYDFASKYNLKHQICEKYYDDDWNYDVNFAYMAMLIKKFEGSEFYSQFSNLEEFNVVFGNFLRLERCKKYLDSMQDKDVKEMLENFLEISLLSICNKVGDFRLLKNDLNLGFEAKLRPEKLIDIKIHQFGSLA